MLTKIQSGSNTYAVYEFENDSAEVDEISIIMINNNQDNAIGLAPIRVESINGVNKKLLFDITGKISIREYVNRRINQSAFRTMMLNLINSIDNFDEYMIDVNQVLLDMDNVYINELNMSVSFICLAIRNQNLPCNLHTFFRNVIENSNVSISMEEKDYFHSVWNVIRNESGFSLNNMKEVLTSGAEIEREQNNLKSTVERTQVSSSAVVAGQVAAVPNAVSQAAKPSSVDNTVTVTPTTPPIYPKNIPTVTPEISQGSTKKKSGLLGKLFGSKKSPKDSSSDAGSKATPKRGGLASFKNSNLKDNNPSLQNEKQGDAVPGVAAYQYQVPVMVNNTMGEAVPNNPMSINMEHNVPAANSQTNNIDLGTTVLDPNPASIKGSQGDIRPSANSDTTIKSYQSNNIPMVGVSDSFCDRGTTVLNSVSKTSNEAGSCTDDKVTNISNPTVSIRKESAMNSNETTVLTHNTDETTVLHYNIHSTLSPYLIRRKNQDKVFVNGDVFRIGKERSQVDYFIADNTAISRMHAKILCKNGEYYIVDTNSTNHTFVNGSLITPNVETRIVSGDILKLANEVFEFKLL